MIKKIIEVILKIKQAGYKAYLVGGSSRDLLLSRFFNDVDIATSAPIKEIKKIFEVVDTKGEGLGSIKIRYKGCVMEITQFREEEYKEGSSYPKIKAFLKDEEEDAKRRDFTINAIYLDASNNQVVDPYHGLEDLMRFQVKLIGDKALRVKEDPTRILRGIRFASKLNFTIEEETNQVFLEYAGLVTTLSKTRFTKEIEKMKEELGESKATLLCANYGILMERIGDGHED